MGTAGRLADTDLVGFAGFAVAVATVADGGSVSVFLELWNRQPVMLGEKRFDYAVEGRVDFDSGLWCVDESHDPGIQAGMPLPDGPGIYGVRVTAYGRQRTADLVEMHGVDHVAAMRSVRALPPDDGEQYRLQIWPC